MSTGTLLQLRTRRSRSSTPLVTNGNISLGVTPQSVNSPQHNPDPHGVEQYSTPTGVTTRRQADASFRNDDKVSPMLAKLRMTPGLYGYIGYLCGCNFGHL